MAIGMRDLHMQDLNVARAETYHRGVEQCPQ
jgi:hypothetical protein